MIAAANDESDGVSQSSASSKNDWILGSVAVPLGVSLLATVVWLAIHFVPMRFNGKVFIAFYLGAYAGCGAASEFFRVRWNSWLVAVIPVTVFISIGFARISFGLQNNMAKFELLIVAMIAGTILICIQAPRIILDVNERWYWAATIPFAFALGFLLLVVSIFSLWAIPVLVLAGIAIAKSESRPYHGGGCSSSGGCGGGGCGGGCGGCGG